MTTFAELRSAIADDMDDTTGEYTQQISNAVLEAIRWCERYTYYFNETRDVTFQTVTAKQFYDSTDCADIATAVRASAVFVIDTGGVVVELDRVYPEDLEVLSGTGFSSGIPSQWAYFARKMRLYPIPDKAYTIRLQLTPYRLAALVNPNDTNAWLSEALDMIKSRAKYIVYKNTIKDPALATEALNDYNEQHTALKRETDSRIGRRLIVPTQF